MKIAMITNTYKPFTGGVQSSVSSFTRELTKRGHTVKIVAPSYEGHTKSSEEVIRVPAIHNVNNTPFSWSMFIPQSVYDQLDAFNPDIIHSHHPFMLGIHAIHMGHRYNAPCIYTKHTQYTRYLHYLPIAGKSIEQFVQKMVTHYLSVVDYVIAPSNTIKKQLPRDINRCKVIPTGLTIENYQNGSALRFFKKYGIAPRTKHIGFVSRLAEEKNLDFIVAVISELSKASKDFAFTIVGDGDKREWMQQQLADYKDSVLFTGELKDEKLIDAYRSFDLFINASLSETQGLVVSEALASGVAVIALDAPGIRDVIRDDYNGLLLDQKSTPEDMVHKIHSFFHPTNTSNRLRLTKNAATSAEQFHIQKTTRVLEDVYKEAAKLKAAENSKHGTPKKAAIASHSNRFLHYLSNAKNFLIFLSQSFLSYRRLLVIGLSLSAIVLIWLISTDAN